jgi:hypothetical protein
MRHKYLLLGLFILITCLFVTNEVFCEIKEEKEEKTLEVEKLRKMPPTYKLSSEAAIFSGYDSNVNLSPISKGDVFEEFLYSLDFTKPWIKGIKFTFDYDLDVLNYSDITDASNILNHFRFGLHKKLSTFNLGTGYDFSIFYYPHNEDGNFLFHKGFFYLKHSLLKNLYQQILLEAGLKEHTERKALSDTISTLQDKELVDRRQSAEYSLGYILKPSLFLKLKLRFSKNDSNARYMDFYDYKSYELSPGINYKFSKQIELFSNFIYIKKDYKSRLVTLSDYKQRDEIYSLNLGMRYTLNKKNILSIIYTYRNNSSPDSLEKYTGNVISLGWQYNF